MDNYFSLYPDLFISSNLFENHLEAPPYIHSIFMNGGANINQISYEHFTNINPDNALSNNHFPKPHDMPFSDHVFSSNSSSIKEGINNEVIHNNDFESQNIEALHSRVMVMLGPHIFDSHNQDVGYPFTNNAINKPHLKFSHNDFIPMPIYDHGDITQVLTSFHNLEFLTQVDTSSNIDYLIVDDTCVKEIPENESQLSCSFNVNKIILFEDSSLSSTPLNLLQTISDPHDYFYDPIDIWLENKFKESSFVNKIFMFCFIRN